ncbi:MAG: hypothetical protein KA354_09380 [Phycisphaerae bacterium]|nr:hypothetical protein [Phycisphaerae bacterium]
MKLRFVLSSVLAGLLLLTSAGCGDQLRDSFKVGVFTYVSGTFSSLQLPTQISDALVKSVISGFGR